MASQYELPGCDKLGGEDPPCISTTGCGDVNGATARSGDSWTGGTKPLSEWWEKAKGHFTE